MSLTPVVPNTSSRRFGQASCLFLAVFVSAVVFAACSSPETPFAISLSGPDSEPARVRVTGFSTAEATALRAAALDASGWRDLLHISVNAETAAVPVAGTYLVVGTELIFKPAFPFDPGRTYAVRFDPARLPRPRSAPVIDQAVALPPSPNAPRVTVAAIYPSADEWPANLLRFYVHFSGPMSRETGVGRVHIIDDTGEEIADALLPSEVDFWSPDQTRYTVFFEPGRVKRGIQPNVDHGRALVPGRTYTISIDAAWRDASLRPLAAPFSRTFRAGLPREEPLSMDHWRVSSPAAGSSEPLVVGVPWSLDRALFIRTLGVSAGGRMLEGQVEVTAKEKEWRFTPAAPWSRERHELVVLSVLEDPSGNRIGRAFEVLPTDPAANREMPERFARHLVIR